MPSAHKKSPNKNEEIKSRARLIPPYMRDVLQVAQHEDEQMLRLVARFQLWYNKNQQKLAALIRVFFPKGFQYAAFRDALRDLQAPFTELELQILFHAVLAPDRLRNVNKCLTPKENLEARFVNLKQFTEGPEEAFKRHTFQLHVGKPAPLDKMTSLKEMVCTMNDELGEIQNSSMKHYLCVHFQGLSHYNHHRRYPHHFEVILPASVTVAQLQMVIRDRMNYSVLPSRIVVRIHGIECKQLPALQRLDELGFPGYHWYSPQSVTVEYLCPIGFIDCSLLGIHKYPCKSAKSKMIDEFIITETAHAEIRGQGVAAGSEPASSECTFLSWT